jgi:hypothetical protein
MTWGFVVVVLKPVKLEEMMCSMYYHPLSHLGVDRYISKP